MITRSSLKQGAVKSTWMIGARVISLLSSFFSTAFVARYLGPEAFGQFGYAASVVAIMGIVATLGTDNIIFRDLIVERDKKYSILGTSLVIRIGLSLLSLLGIVLFGFFFISDHVAQTLVLILSLPPIIASLHVLSHELYAQSNTLLPSIFTALVSIIISVLKIIVVYNGGGVLWLGVSLIGEAVLLSLCYVLAFKYVLKLKFFNLRFDKTYGLSLLKDSIPLAMLGASMTIFARVDQIMLRHFLNVSAVGMYDPVVRIIETSAFLSATAITVAAPKLALLRSVDKEKYEKFFKYIAFLSVASGIMIAAIITLLSPIIVSFILGNKYTLSASIMQVYTWTIVGSFASIALTTYLTYENKRLQLLATGIIPMVINIGLNLILIPQYGVYGAAFSTVTAYFLGPFLWLIWMLLIKKNRSHSTT